MKMKFNKEGLIVDAQEKAKDIHDNQWKMIKFANTYFKMGSYYYTRGDIFTNCESKAVQNLDLKVIDMLNVKELEKLENDLKYILNLIDSRKEELLHPETITELKEYEYKQGNKKMYHIEVIQYVKYSDIYEDYEETSPKTLEEYNISNTKPHEQEIEDKIKELNIKIIY
jgi:hypothetical protein